jgi:hypothetical protein
VAGLTAGHEVVHEIQIANQCGFVLGRPIDRCSPAADEGAVGPAAQSLHMLADLLRQRPVGGSQGTAQRIEDMHLEPLAGSRR